MKPIDKNRLKEVNVLPRPNRGVAFRHWLGIYTKDERAVLAYSKRLQTYSLRLVSGQEIMTERPEWMRFEDYKKLQQLANKHNRRNRR